ncbi:hypothetical protein [Gracilibacillus thailandensis]|uniref:Uncharacterized protein n=1 Tax=Gracilibacillus thailandensis TaxID=563735 RepID=A0A6N7QZ31_9BACI|nr:hypothetical protein [Gracilibacillus thailandensis]MRI65169.1 hypothetical protein [Gracilibacillus thailandensis]
MEQNQEYVVQSLIGQIAENAGKLASRDAIIVEKNQKIKQLEEELAEYRNKEIEEMEDESQ